MQLGNILKSKININLNYKRLIKLNLILNKLKKPILRAEFRVSKCISNNNLKKKCKINQIIIILLITKSTNS